MSNEEAGRELDAALAELRAELEAILPRIEALESPTPTPDPSPRHPLMIDPDFHDGGLLPEAFDHYRDALRIHDGDQSYPNWRDAAQSGDTYDVARHLAHHTTALMVGLAATGAVAFANRLLQVANEFLNGLHPAGTHGVPYRHFYRRKGGGGGAYHEMDSIMSAKVAAVLMHTLNLNRDAYPVMGQAADRLRAWLDEWEGMWTAKKGSLPAAYLTHPALALSVVHDVQDRLVAGANWAGRVHEEARHEQPTSTGTGTHYDFGLNDSTVPDEPLNLEYGSLALLSLMERALMFGSEADTEEVVMAARSVADAALDDPYLYETFGHDWKLSDDDGPRWSRAKYEIMSYHLLTHWNDDVRYQVAAQRIRDNRGNDPRSLSLSVGLMVSYV